MNTKRSEVFITLLCFLFNSILSNCISASYVYFFTKMILGKPNPKSSRFLMCYVFFSSTIYVLSFQLFLGNYAIELKYRNIWSIIAWSGLLIYCLSGFRSKRIFIRFLNFIVSGICLLLADVIAALAISTVDILFDTELYNMFMSNDKWDQWYCFMTYLPSCIILLVLYITIKKIYFRFHSSNTRKKIVSFLIFPLSQFFILFTLTTIYQKINSLFSSPYITILSVVTLLLNAVSNVIWLYFMKKVQAKEELERQLQLIKQYESLSLRYQEQTETAAHEIAKLRHDFNHQMQVLSGLILANETDDAMQLANELKQNYYNAKLNFQYCENQVVNIILQQYSEICEKKHIQFETKCTLKDNISVRKVDLCSILINLLQNAVQACDAVPEEERLVSCFIWQEQEMLFLRIRNSKKNIIQKRNGQFITTQNDSSKHGFGMEIIEHIVKSYDGIVTVKYDDIFFAVIVQMNLPL